MRRRWSRVRGCVISGVLGALCATFASGASAAESGMTRIYLGVNAGHLLSTGPEILSKVVVVNPNIADVRVLSPTQLLVTGKAAGVTSLVLVYPRVTKVYDLAVQPGPVGGAIPIPAGAEPFVVVVQRGDKVSQTIFWRDKDRQWVEMSPSRSDAEAAAPKPPEPAKQ